MMYYKWKNLLHPSIMLSPIELSGRGKRFREKLYKDMDEAIEDIFNQIKNQLSQEPYAIFGHSLGAYLSYELAKKIRRLNMPQPIHTFFSGRGAPHLEEKNNNDFHLLDENQLKDKLKDLGGTPSDFFENKELMSYMLPIIRNDFRLAFTDCCTMEIDPFNFNISILMGKNEQIRKEQIDGWNSYTTKECNINLFDGGHFFIQHQSKSITELINKTLLKVNTYHS